MPNTFFIADTHFGHANILAHEPEARPFRTVAEHDEALIARWNAVVRPGDVVWHLGDFAWSHDAACHALERLKGRIKLVLGDHEPKWLPKDRVPGVEEVHGVVKWRRGIALSHVPLALGGKFQKCLHGHMHAKSLDDPRYYCVSVEHTGLAPVLWNDLNEELNW